jgi:hypothetical protein
MGTLKNGYGTEETYQRYIDSLREDMYKALTQTLEATTFQEISEASSEFWARSEAVKDAEAVQKLRRIRKERT